MKKATITIDFTTREYVRDHGKAPRGYGRWGFEFEGCYEFWHTGTFAECKKACREYVKSVAPEGYTGFVTVNVLP